MTYYKIRLKGLRERSWIDDYNLPDPKDPRRTQRFKTLQEAKKAFRRTTWGIPHYKHIVKVTPKHREIIHTSGRVFAQKARTKPSPKTRVPRATRGPSITPKVKNLVKPAHRAMKGKVRTTRKATRKVAGNGVEKDFFAFSKKQEKKILKLLGY